MDRKIPGDFSSREIVVFCWGAGGRDFGRFVGEVSCEKKNNSQL